MADELNDPPTVPSVRSPVEDRVRRRERDTRAENRAMIWVIGGFLLLGALGFIVLNWDSTERPPGPSASSASPSPVPTQRVAPSPRRASRLDETPDIPALNALRQVGLTVGAEGIPKVEGKGITPARAGTEACRFSFGVWELSPNQTFRFLSTCRGLAQVEHVGAYEERGADIYLSTLSDGVVAWSSVLSLQHPSKMRSIVATQSSRIQVAQRITTVRRGLHGSDFRDAYLRRNDLRAPSAPAPRSPSPSKETSGSTSKAPSRPARPSKASPSLEELLSR